MNRLEMIVARGLAAVLLVAGGCAHAPHTETPPPGARLPAVEIELLGEVTLPGDLRVDGHPVGGLSGVAWERTCDEWVALSDDPAMVSAPRAFRLRVDLADGRLDPGDVEVVSVLLLRRPDGDVHGELEIDPEGIEVDGGGRLWVSSEGQISFGVAGFLGRYAGDGTRIGGLDLPASVLASQRHNLGLEGLALTPDGRHLVGGIENALVTDGPESDLDVPSPVRILRWNLAAGGPPDEFLYLAEATPDAPTEEGAFRVNGVTDLVALGPDTLIVLERSFAVGVGNRARLYLTRLTPESEVTGVLAAPGHPTAPKRLLTDLEELGADPDNLEGMDLGPELPDGRRLLLMVSDNNFQPDVQDTQVVALAVSGAPAAPSPGPVAASIPEVQGPGWLSPHVGRCVAALEGVVTAVRDVRAGGVVAWIQATPGDGDPATSDALVAGIPEDLPAPSVGYRVRFGGRVEERAPGLDLPVTSLAASALRVVASEEPLPEAVPLDTERLPLGHLGSPFEPDGAGALAAFERLEAMHVEVPPADVAGSTTGYGQTAVVTETASRDLTRTVHGGVLREEGDQGAGRILLENDLSHDPPWLKVGDRLAGALTGVLDLAYGAWHVKVAESWPTVVPGDAVPETSRLGPVPGRLRFATFNAENLSAVSPRAKVDAVARVIVHNLRAPEILALQEIQDHSGPADDGVVSAEGTLSRLAAAITRAGGPAYRWRQLEPEDGADGGQPGANIRNAVLFDPARVNAVDGPGRILPASPVRLFEDSPAFGGDPLGREGGTRKPLAVELEADGERLVVVNLHLSSKWGDDPLFGRRQPPLEPTAAMRRAQAERIAGFVEEILDRRPEAKVLVLGDLNDFIWSEAVRTLSAGRLENLLEHLPVSDRYTYVYRGWAQVLDHVLVSPAVVRTAEVDVVHANADFPDHDRASDHDPVVVSFVP